MPWSRMLQEETQGSGSEKKIQCIEAHLFFFSFFFFTCMLAYWVHAFRMRFLCKTLAKMQNASRQSQSNKFYEKLAYWNVKPTFFMKGPWTPNAQEYCTLFACVNLLHFWQDLIELSVIITDKSIAFSACLTHYTIFKSIISPHNSTSGLWTLDNQHKV